jgi:hypothetical protein
VKSLTEQTLYEVLEVPCDAPQGDVARAYERALALYGPGSIATFTLMAPDEAALLGARLEEARSILLDPIARAAYDAQLSGTPAPTPGRGEDGTAPLPPIIPALRSKAARRKANADAGALGAPAAPIALETVATPIALETIATPIPLAAVAPQPTPPPIQLSAPVPLSPPFAAVSSAPPSPAPPAAPRAAARPIQKDIFVHEGTRFTGDVLRRAREARGLTVPALAERTKITRHHIDNLEADRHDKLPAPVYLRGILMAIAKELRLDGQKVARSYIEAMAAGAAGGPARPR